MDNSKRATNFNTAEEQLLISLVAKHQKILECKKTDAVSSQAKESEWKLLAEEYNSSSTSFRNHVTLRRKYENVKKRSKKAFSEEKCYRQGTGGGPPSSVNITDTDLQLKEMLGTQITGLSSQFDDDAEVDVSHEQIVQVGDDEEDEVMEAAFESPVKDDVKCNTASASHTTWASYTPAMLRKPRSMQLMPAPMQHKSIIEEIRQKSMTSKESSTLSTGSVRSKRGNAAASWDSVALAKLELIQLQKRAIETDMVHKDAEHELKMEHLAEEHKLKLKLLQLEIKLKEKQLEHC